MRCGMDTDRGAACESCAPEMPEVGKLLPHDENGPWLRSMKDTTVAILREPFGVFRRLADGPTRPALNFAAWCAVAASLLSSLPLWTNIPQPTAGVALIGKLLSGAIIAALTAGFRTFVLGSLFYLSARPFGPKLSWSLALRTEGYSAAWVLPAMTIGLSIDFETGVPLLAGMNFLVEGGGKALAFYAVARWRARHSTLGVLFAVALPVGLWSAMWIWAYLRQLS